MKNGDIDILIGTKMIARGYHFKNVELVGIICGDLHLGIPHVSSVEKTIQENSFVFQRFLFDQKWLCCITLKHFVK